MRIHIILSGVFALAVFAVGPVSAQTPCTGRPCVDQKWQALHKLAEAQITKQSADAEPARANTVPPDLASAIQERRQATTQASIIAAVDGVEPDDSTAAATVRRLAGAIKTNPEGTEAGIVIAPFALAGSEVLPGLEVTFAALEGDFTRSGISYTKDASPKLADVWKTPAACPIGPRIKKLDRPRDFYFTACTGVVARIPATLTESSGLSDAERTAYATRVSQASVACGFTSSGSTAGGTLPEAIALVRRAVEVTNTVAARTTEIPAPEATLALALRPEATALTDWSLASATSCYAPEDIRGYFSQLYWRVRTWKLAGSVSFDLFPRKYGFSPDDSELPNGDVKSGEARVDFSTARAGTEVSAGVGFGRSRDELGDELRGYIGPSVSIAHAFSLLPKKSPLTTNGELNVVDGEMPPRLVLGISAAIEVALKKRDSQETRFNSVKVQPHLDFLINDTLSFRLGIPVKAETVVREQKEAQAETATTPAVPAVAGKRALQWTVPVAIVAVLKL
jgi:hypothetical protein